MRRVKVGRGHAYRDEKILCLWKGLLEKILQDSRIRSEEMFSGYDVGAFNALECFTDFISIPNL